MIVSFLLVGDIWQNTPFMFFISNETIPEGDDNINTSIYSGPPNYGDHSYLLNNIYRILQYVKVERNSPGLMTICEIKITRTSKRLCVGSLHLSEPA